MPRKGKILISCGWNEVPHLTQEAKDHIRENTPEHLKASREFGTPSMGAGAVYAVDEKDVFISPFRIPQNWPIAFAMDVGWKRTAVLWGALDRGTDTMYIFKEHYMGQAKPNDHVAAMKGVGLWMPGWIDPASKGRSQEDGKQLMKTYKQLGLSLKPALNAVETGISKVYMRLLSGRLKIFTSCPSTRAEFRIYRRNEHGKVVKEDDHAMDALRYLVMSPLSQWKYKPLDFPRGMFTSPKFGNV